MKPNFIFLSAEATTAAEAAGSANEFAAGSFVFIAIAAVAIVMIFAIMYVLFFRKKKTIMDSSGDNRRKIQIKNNSDVAPVNKAAAIAEEQAVKVVVRRNEPFVQPEEDEKAGKKEKKKAKRSKAPAGEKGKSPKQKKVKAIKYKPLASPSINDEQPRRIAVDYSVADSVETRDALQSIYETELAAMTAPEPIEEPAPVELAKPESVELAKPEPIEEPEPVVETVPVDLAKPEPIEEPEPVAEHEQVVEDVEESEPMAEPEKVTTPVYEPYTNKFSKVTDIFGNKKILIAAESSINVPLTKAHVVNIDDIVEHGPYSANDVVTFKIEAPFKCGTDVKYAIGISQRVQSNYQLLDVVTDDAYDGTHQYIELSVALRTAIEEPIIDIEYGFDKSFNGKYLVMMLRVS